MLFDKTPKYKRDPAYNQTAWDYFMFIMYDLPTLYQVLWGIFFVCLGSIMMLMSNWTLRICVFTSAFIVLFFFMSWTFI